MPYKLIELIQMTVCRFFGHRKGRTWEFDGKTHSICKRCRHIYVSDNFYKERTFRDAVSVCKVSGSIYRASNTYKKYAKNHPVPLKKRVPLLDRISKDWIISE